MTSSHRPGKKSAADPSQSGRWTREEHLLFLQGLQQHGKEWKKIAKLVQTRSLVQIRSHAQKYFSKLAAVEQSGQQIQGNLLMDGKRKKNVNKKNGNTGSKRTATANTPTTARVPSQPDLFTLPAASPSIFDPPAAHLPQSFSPVHVVMPETQHLTNTIIPSQTIFHPQPHQGLHAMYAPSFQQQQQQPQQQQPQPLPPHQPQPQPQPMYTQQHIIVTTQQVPVGAPQAQTFTTYAPAAPPMVPCSTAATFLPRNEEFTSEGDVDERESVRGSLADSRDGSTSTSSLSSYATTTESLDDRLDPLDLFTPEELELFVHDFLPEEMTKRTVQVPPGLTEKYNGDVVFDSEVIEDWLNVEEAASTPTGATAPDPALLSFGGDFPTFSC